MVNPYILPNSRPFRPFLLYCSCAPNFRPIIIFVRSFIKYAEQQRRAIFNRLETQSWVGRTQFQPHLVRLHPFERQIGVAYKNKIMVNDWSRSTLQSYVPSDASACSSSLRQSTSKLSSVTAATEINLNSWVSALEFINCHDSTLILAGYDDGCVRIWRPSDATTTLSSSSSASSTDGVKESRLLTAWQAMVDVTTSKFQSKYEIALLLYIFLVNHILFR